MAESSSKYEDVIQKATAHFKRCEEFEQGFRQRFLQDVMFANADPDNGWQWPTDILKDRQTQERPALTINKTRQHNLQITNDQKQNRPQIKVIPTGGDSTYDSAEVFEGVIRHIEYVSNAEDAYDTAGEFQVEGGIGYWRVVTDYLDNSSFDQEIFIRRIKNPMSVYLDPDIKEFDGSDAMYGFVFEDMSRDDFEYKYPDYADKVGTRTPFEGLKDWMNEERVRVAEYYCKSFKKDTMAAIELNDGTTETFLLSSVDRNMRRVIKADETIKKREIDVPKITWYLIAGDQVLDTRDWAGSYVPIVRVVGEERIIEGQLDRKGHTRAMKDAQRMYNYWTSSAVEFVALQGKQPYIGAVEAIAGYEDVWKNANLRNYSFLPYNSLDDNGTQIAPPMRQEPPMMAQGYISGMQVAAEELKMVSGQYDNQMGMAANEVSGVAIMNRNRQGDRATYHFTDHLATAIRFTGKILIDLIPKIYDTPRIIRILAEDGEESRIKLDPNLVQPLEEQDSETEEVSKIFNPAVGSYDVQASTGPGYQTRRQEAFSAFQQIASQNPQLMQVAGDLMFKAADFPLADELAERIAKTIPENLKGEGPSPETQEAQAQVQQLEGLVAQLTRDLQEMAANKEIDAYKAETKAEIDAYKAQIDEYKAETERFKATKEAMTPENIAAMAAQMIMDAQAASENPVLDVERPSSTAAARGQANEAKSGAIPAQPPINKGPF